jgi:hypothetical protein
MALAVALCAGGLLLTERASAACLEPPGDITQNGTMTVTDVQCEILAVLVRLASATDPMPSCAALVTEADIDLNCDAGLSVSDIQISIQLALGTPVDPLLDANGDSCVDVCGGPCVGKPNGTACNADSNGCTQNDSCQAGVCVAGVAPNCGDGLACTTDACTSTGNNTFSCTNTLNANRCLIGGACYLANENNPNNACQACVPATSTTQFTNKNNGTACNADSNGCTQNDSCQAGVCVAGDAANCGDGLACTTDACASTGNNTFSCTNTLNANRCLIGGACYLANENNPNNACQACVPTTSTTQFTNKNNGTACNADSNGCTQNDACQAGICVAGAAPNCGDGLACTTDACASSGNNTFSCTNTLNANRCLIGGVCYQSGDENPNNACQACVPATSTTQFTNKNNGTACNADSNGCTQNDACQAGVCVAGTATTCGDGLACTTDACTSTGNNTFSCTNTLNANRCLIGGACYLANEENPNNTCQACVPATSTTQFTNKSNGTACNADSNGCTQNDACQAGVCVAGTAANCNDNLACTTDTCSSTGNSTFSCTNTLIANRCLVAGVCYQANVNNPSNVCQACIPATSTTQFSNKTNGTSCNADSNGCTQSDSCQAGTCTAGAPQTCSDSLACTADVCTSTGNASFTCANPLIANRCLIGGVCYTQGEDSPTNSCQRCNAAQSTTAFSPKANGAACEDGEPCTIGDTCQAGTCTSGGANPCDDGTTCTLDSCAPSIGCVHTPVAIFVDDSNSSGVQDGTSWATAFTTIADALAAASAGEQIFVARGVYFAKVAPGQFNPWSIPVVDMKAGVALYGGFVGTECAPLERPLPVSGSILSPDRDKDGLINLSVDTRIVVDGASDATLDGFTVGGFGGANGTLVYNQRQALESRNTSNLTIRNCEFRNNLYPVSGFISGAAQMGPAVLIKDSVNTHVENCLFEDNTTTFLDAAAIGILGSTDTLIDGCTFRHNSADSAGALSITSSGGFEIRDSLFYENVAMGTTLGAGGGAVSTFTNVSADIINSTFIRNSSHVIGGALLISGSSGSIDVVGSSFYENDADSGSAIYNSFATPVTVRNCAIFDGVDQYLDLTNVATVSYTCISQSLAGTNLVNLNAATGDPFVELNQRLYLKHGGLDGNTASSGCVGAGLDADSAAAQIDFASLTTRTDGALDVSPVDAGVHNYPCDNPNTPGCTNLVGCATDIECDDGLGCTDDSCEEVLPGVMACVNGIKSNRCLVGGSCFVGNEANPANECQVCKPAVNKFGWSNVSEGTQCALDNNGCTFDQCVAGVCVAGAPGSTCNDNLSCTTDTCTSTGALSATCSNAPQTGTCAVGGACFTSGQINPQNACQRCTPSLSQTAWSNRPNGTLCSDGNVCTTKDECQAGACTPVGFASCNDNNACTVDACDPISGCSNTPVAIFVNPDGAGNPKDGSSWSKGFATLAEALDAAQPGGQIWVKQGHYSATGAGLPVAVMKAGVSLFGGFVGNECALSSRPQPPLPTVLSGDVDGDGTYNAGDSETLVVGASNAVLDGFVLGGFGGTEGELVWEGSTGLVADGVSGLTIRSCIFRDFRQEAFFGAAADIIDSTDVIFEDCTFSNNLAAGSGGALALSYTSAAEFNRCTFTDNACGNRGNALWAANVDGLVIRDSTFAYNGELANPLPLAEGGALALVGTTAVSILNSAFVGNAAADRGGAVFLDLDTAATFVGCSFADNASGAGGLLYAGVDCAITLTNCASYANAAATGPEIYLEPTASPLSTAAVTNTCIAGGYAGTGNVTLPAGTGDPFVRQGTRLYLKHAGLNGQASSSPCVNAGSNAAYNQAGIAWNQATTRTDGALDAAPSDAGVRYATCAGKANGTACSDGDECTLNDACAGSVCVPGAPINCDDGQSITIDTCSAGFCVYEYDCDDGNPCTTDFWNPGLSACQSEPVAIFVDPSSSDPTPDGTSWASAFATLSAAMAAATAGDVIFVADGTFKSSSATTPVLTMKSDVAIYGGFTGSECSIGARPTPLAATILSGDFNNNNAVGAGDSARVVTAQGAQRATIDGFTIRGGYNAQAGASGNGAGLYGLGAVDLTVRRCRFENNWTVQGTGAALYLDSAEGVTVDNCTFSANQTSSIVATPAGVAGLTAVTSDNLLVIDSIFNGNDGMNGGALRIFDCVGAEVRNTIFRDNLSDNRAAAIMLDNSVATLVANCTFRGNVAGDEGGALFNLYSYDTLVVGSSFTENTASVGGGLYTVGALVEVKNSALWGNGTTGGATSEWASSAVAGSSFDFAHTCIRGGVAGLANVTLSALATGNPFTPVGNKLFLRHNGLNGATSTTACVNAGNDATASLYSIPYTTLTTRSDGGLDSTPVDVGVHYAP